MISGLILLPVVHNFSRVVQEVKANFSFVFLIAFLQVIVQYSLFYIGISLLPASISAMIVGSSPLFIALVAHFFIKDDRINWPKSMSFILGIVGVAVVSIGRKSLPSGAEIALGGVGLLILNNLVSGVSNVVLARQRHTISPLVLTSSSLFFGGLSLLLISFPLEGIPQQSFPPEYFVALAWLSFLSAAAFTIWNTLLRRPGIKVSELNMWKFLIPVSGAVLSWIILPDESPDRVSVAGMVFIGIALVILNFSYRKLNETRKLK